MLTSKTEETRTAAPAQTDLRPRRRIARPVRVILQIVLMLVVLGAGLFGMNRLIATKPEIAKRPPFPKVYTVDTVIAHAGDFQPVFTVYGEIVARRSVDLRSLVAGQVVSVSSLLKPGARVAKGASLVEIDRFDYEGALREARANLAEAEARLGESRAGIAMEENKLERAREQLEFAVKDLDRFKSLKTSGSATDKQLEDRELVLSQRAATVDQTGISITAKKAQLAQQQAVLERLRWKVDLASRNLENTVLTAPFDGIVRSAQVEAGKMVSANDVAVSLYEEGNLEVRFTLSNDRYARITSSEPGLIGRAIEIVPSLGGEKVTLPATVDRLGADIETSRGGVEVYARLTTPQAAAMLRPGAFVEVRVPDRVFSGQFRLPETAVHDNDTVYAVSEGRLSPRAITVSAWDGENAIATGDIHDGDEILVTRIAEIGEGLRVAPHSGEPKGGAPPAEGSKASSMNGAAPAPAAD